MRAMEGNEKSFFDRGSALVRPIEPGLAGRTSVADVTDESEQLIRIITDDMGPRPTTIATIHARPRRLMAARAAIMGVTCLVVSCSITETGFAAAMRSQAPMSITSLDQAESILLPEAPAANGNGLDESMVAAAAFALENIDADPKAISLLGLALARGEGDASARAALKAIERSSSPSLRVLSLVASRASIVGESERAALIAALGAFPSRDAARLILRLSDQRLGVNGSGLVDPGTLAALRRLSGRVDLTAEAQSWRDWLAGADQLSESQWRLAVAQAQAQRAQRAEADRSHAVQRLVESLRRLHLTTPAEERGVLIAGFMRDSMAEVRSLGLDLAGRELQASGRLSQDVGQAAIGLLSSSDPQERTRAAEIVRQVSPDGAGPAVAQALAREQDPAAAGALIQAATRWPTDLTIDRTIRWMDRGGVARRQALDAALTLLRAGALPEPARQRTLELVRLLPDSEMTGASCLLLSNLGNDADRLRLVPLLSSEVAGVRVGAADGLVWDVSYLPAILNAAAKHGDLFDAAVRAVMANDPSDDNYRAIANLAGAGTDAGRRGLARVAELMPSSDLVEIVRTTRDRVLRTDLLLLLTSPRRVQSEWADRANAAAILQGGIDLARSRMGDGDLIGAASVLAALPLDGPESEGLDAVPEARLLRAVSVVALGRLDDPLALAAPAEAWVDALSYVATPEDRASLAQEITTRFGSQLTDAQRARVGQFIAVETSPAEGG